MKKIILLLLAGLLFISCTGLQDTGATGELSFTCSRSALRAAASRTVGDDGDGNGNGETDVFMVSLAGEYTDSITLVLGPDDDENSGNDNETITFQNVPVGATIYVEAKLYSYIAEAGSTSLPDFSQTNPDAYGRSASVVISEGINFIPLTLFNFFGRFPFTITINSSGLSESELESLANSLSVYGIAKESSLGRSITATASDTVKLYETLTADIDDIVSGVDLYNSNGYSNYTISGSSIIATASLYMPIDFSAPAEKGQEAFVIAAKRTENTATNPVTYKTKYFGQSTSLIPYKTTTNTATLTLSKMDIIDTPVVTYQSNGNGMVYTLDTGSTYNSQNSNVNFCFDLDGNMYYLQPDSGADYIVKSSKSSTGTTISPYEHQGTNWYENIDFTSFTPKITVDHKTNVMYEYWQQDGYKIIIFQYPTLITNGTVVAAETKSWGLLPASTTIDGTPVIPYPTACLVYDNTAYIIATEQETTSSYYGTYFLYWYSLNGEAEESKVVTTGTRLNIPAYGSITDMVYADGAIYMLLKDFDKTWNRNSTPQDESLSSRGAIIKYDLSTEALTIKGFSNDVYENTSFTDVKMNVYGTNNTTSLVCKSYIDFNTPNTSNPLILQGNSILHVDGDDYLMNLRFPTIYTPAPLENNISTTNFYGPDRFIAIKPKKLVFSDDGIAFYTDEGFLRYKNVDRIVTVDLEDFAVSVSTTSVKFSENLTNMIAGQFNIGGTDFGSRNNINDSVYFLSDGGSLTDYYPGTNHLLNLGITRGE